jgi:hypothetical protein
MDLKLVRLLDTGEGTLGILFINGFPIFTTLEPPYKNNLRNISSIPLGTYQGKKFNSPKYGKTFQLEVEGRDAIEFHPGNFPHETQGCILLGCKFAQNSTLAIYDSAKAFQIFQKLTEEIETINLSISMI